MDKDNLNAWQQAVDSAEDTRDPYGIIPPELPADTRVGQEYYYFPAGGQKRKYIKVCVVAGAAGSRWAYWRTASKLAERVQPNPQYEVIVDRIFNGDQWHFAGMLVREFEGMAGRSGVEAWILAEPKMREIPHELQQKPQEQYMTRDGKRYEKSSEVYDVTTKESKLLP